MEGDTHSKCVALESIALRRDEGGLVEHPSVDGDLFGAGVDVESGLVEVLPISVSLLAPNYTRRAAKAHLENVRLQSHTSTEALANDSRQLGQHAHTFDQSTFSIIDACGDLNVRRRPTITLQAVRLPFESQARGTIVARHGIRR